MNRIIYKNLDSTLSVLIPSQEALAIYGIEAIALKDTPIGLPFWIVDTSMIPVDRTNREAWTIDEVVNIPDGYGHKSHEFEGVMQ